MQELGRLEDPPEDYREVRLGSAAAADKRARRAAAGKLKPASSEFLKSATEQPIEEDL